LLQNLVAKKSKQRNIASGGLCNMRTEILLFTIGVFLFSLGFIVGSAFERRSLHMSDNQETIIYQGFVYTRIMGENTLESYLTAAGRSKTKRP
jgi:hypothetical protein